MKARLLILAAAGFALAACAPEETGAPEESAVAAPLSEQDVSPRAYFEATFSGRWGANESCAEEGMFRLAPDELGLYERTCEVLDLIRDGAMIAARTRCIAEGRPMAENTHMLTPVSDDTITVSDGHYEWTRHACGAAEAQTQGAPQ